MPLGHQVRRGDANASALTEGAVDDASPARCFARADERAGRLEVFGDVGGASVLHLDAQVSER